MEEEKTTIPIERQITIDEKRQYKMNPQMFKAASSGDSSFFENLVGSDPNSSTLLEVTTQKNTVLHIALQFKKFEAAEKIVNLSPRLVYEKNSKGNTPLHVAAIVGTPSLVWLLIDHTKKLDIESGGGKILSMLNLYGDTTLHVAVRYGKSEIVKVLIKEDPELAMCVNNAGESALFLAVDKQRYNMASHILSAALDCSYAGRHGMNVLHALVIHTITYSKKVNYLIQGDKEKDGNASRFDHFLLTFVWELLKKKKKTFVWVINLLFLIPLPELLEDASEEKNWKRLCQFGNIPTDLVKEVMTKWPSTIEQGDGSGWTPLHIAAHMGNVEFVKLLLENGNSPAYVRNKEGLTALHIAAKEGNYGVMKELMEACPDIYELLDNKGRNALHAAAESEYWRIAFDFFEERPEFEGLINEQDEEGNTPSNLAAINGDIYHIEQKLGKSRDIVLNGTNKEGFTTMDYVLLTSKLHSQRAKELWNIGARVSLRGALLKMGIQILDPRKETKLSGDGNGNGNGEGRSKSDFMKQRSESKLWVATLIATVTFTAAFTVPGGYNSKDGVDEGSAVLSRKTSFQIFLIANSAAFGLSLASVFSHFTASNMMLDFILHKKFVARAPDSPSYSTFAMLLAFILGTYTVVPHNLGITVAVIVCWCFFSSYIISLLHTLKSSLPPLVSGLIRKQNKEK